MVKTRLGVPQAPPTATCQRWLPAEGRRCESPLDAAGHHTYTCSKHIMRARHDGIRDHIAKSAMLAGWYAATEQRTAADIRLDENVTTSSGWNRPVRTADVHILTRAGQDLYGDVRIFSLCPGQRLEAQLKTHENAKRKEYGLDLAVVGLPTDGLRPLVAELGGGIGPCFYSFALLIIKQWVSKLQVQMGVLPAVAWQRAALGFWQPIACILARTRWQAHAECMRP